VRACVRARYYVVVVSITFHISDTSANLKTSLYCI